MLPLLLLLQVASPPAPPRDSAAAVAADTSCAPRSDGDDVNITIAIGRTQEEVERDEAWREAAAKREQEKREARERDAGKRDSASAAAPCKPKKVVRRQPVTPFHLRTAYGSPAARTLFENARAARTLQDTTLETYDATAYQRLSAWLSFRKTGRSRLAFRTENASRVQWKRGSGAQVELKGARTAVPIIGTMGMFMSRREADELKQEFSSEFAAEMSELISPIPYYPGRDQLFFSLSNEGNMRLDVDESDIIHPLANGAEAYYHYSVGDSATIRLPDGRAIVLRELVVRARQPRWNLAIASLWFDVGSSHLVRAAYRFSEPLDIQQLIEEEDDDEDIPAAVKPLIFPMTANISALTVEYGLHQGRFWLPRAQSLEGDVRVGIMHVPFEARERFTYASVNGPSAVAAVPARDSSLRLRLRAISNDSTLSDSARRVLRREVQDSARKARSVARRDECAATGSYTSRSSRADGSLSVVTRIPCDTLALAHDPGLPPSIYDSGEEVFGEEEMQALRDQLLTLDAQAGFEPQRPRLTYGLAMTRYNRVEGLSSGLAVEQRLGAGYTIGGAARLGIADLVPNAEAYVARTDGRRTLQLGGYQRLVAANDWGAPLGFGSSANALLFGRDDGFYYRTTGLELLAIGGGRALFEYRLFAEHQNDATRETHLSLARAINHDLRMRPNIRAREGDIVGTAVRMAGSRGADPAGLRLTSDLRAEGGTGQWSYGRLASDLTISHGLWRLPDAALTVAGGTTVGEVPVQRLWYLGGAGSVRGQRAGTGVGDAFWLARAELGTSSVGMRPVVFADVGWAGDRDAWRHPGTPMSGVGIGASFLDGLVRFDLSRGIRPRQETRVDAYLEARF